MQVRSVLYLWRQLMLSFTWRTLWPTLLAILLTMLMVLLMAFVLLLALGKVEEVSVHLLVAIIRPTAQEDLSAFYAQSVSWPEVKQVRYVFPEQAAPSDEQLPMEARQYGYFEVQLREGADRALIEMRLRAQVPWLQVIPRERGLLRRVWQDRPTLRPIVFSGLSILFLACLAVFYIALHRLARDWMPELELLKLSGMSERMLSLPFVLLALLSGALAAAGTVALGSLIPPLIRRIPAVNMLVPELRSAPLAGELGLVAFAIGLGLSVLIGLMGLVAADRCLGQLSLAGPFAPKLARAKAQEKGESQPHEEDLQRLERQ